MRLYPETTVPNFLSAEDARFKNDALHVAVAV
jgi:hypothetical protein